MNRTKLVVANWKLHLSVPESTVLLEKYLATIKPEKTEVVICPSYVDIYSASEVLQRSFFKIGAQDIFYEDEGAYTGEVSPDQLRGFVEYAIVGHSERRRNFGETDKIVAKKAATAIRHGITPIVCVGENLHEKLDGLTKLVVAGQTEASLANLTKEEVAQIVIAYEPVWSIGTGHVCDPKSAADTISSIRNLIRALYGEKVAESVRIIYGGSIDDKNIKAFLLKDEIDGYLVGGSSLKHDIFTKIVNAVDSGKNSILNSKSLNKSQKSISKSKKSGKNNKK